MSAFEGKKLQCTCSRDSAYPFGCKSAIVWFAENVLIMKIRRLQKSGADVDIKSLILTEYEKCRQQYKLLKKLKPKDESEMQIERDLSRTFPKNEFFHKG